MRTIRSALMVTILIGVGIAAAPVSAAPVVQAAAAQAGAPIAAIANIKPDLVERAKTHNLRPSHVLPTAAVLEAKQLEGPAGIVKKNIVYKPMPVKPHLNVGKMGEDLHAALKDNVRGYAFQVRKNGNPIYTLIWDWARSPNQGSKGWSLDTKMHVASVSKVITAIATVKALDERGLGFDSKIGPYIPTYWTVGQNSGDITFKELLTHRSGITDHDGSYPAFKGAIAHGVPQNPSYFYTNGGFSINRVLISTMTGVIAKNANFAVNNDNIWDLVTTDAFENYVRTKVFQPSGVTGVSTSATPGSAFAYSRRADVNGWDSGDLSTQLGGAGFRVSVNDMLDIMGTFRRKGTIVSKEKAQQALDASLGIDRIQDTAAGKYYLKNGWWGGGGTDAPELYHVEQAVAVFLPDDMEAVILSNSNVGSQQISLTTTMMNAINNNIEQ